MKLLRVATLLLVAFVALAHCHDVADGSKRVARRLKSSVVAISADALLVDQAVVWSRETTPIIHVSGVLEIAEGASLTITAGVTVVLTSRDSRIVNHGLLRIQGGQKTEDRVVLRGNDSTWGGIEFGSTAVGVEYADGDKDTFDYVDGSIFSSVDFVNVKPRERNQGELSALSFPHGIVPLLDNVRILECDGVAIRVSGNDASLSSVMVVRDAVVAQKTGLRVAISIDDIDHIVLQNVRIERPRASKAERAFQANFILTVLISSCVFDGGNINMKKIRRAKLWNNVVRAPAGVHSLHVARLAKIGQSKTSQDKPRSLFHNNTFVGGKGILMRNRGGRVSFEQNTIRDTLSDGLVIRNVIGPIEMKKNNFVDMSSALFSILTSQVRFVNNVIANCTSPGSLFLLRERERRKRKQKWEADQNGEVLFTVRDLSFLVTDNIVRGQNKLSYLVDVRSIPVVQSVKNPSAEDTFTMPANYWGGASIRNDIVNGERRKVLDGLTGGSGPLVDFVTIKKESTRTSPLIPVSLPSGIINERPDGTVVLGGILRTSQDSLRLENLGTDDTVFSIVVSGNATLFVGENVNINFREGTTMSVQQNGTLIVDGGDKGTTSLVFPTGGTEIGIFSNITASLRTVTIENGVINHDSRSGLTLNSVIIRSNSPAISVACVRSAHTFPETRKAVGMNVALQIINSMLMHCGDVGIDASYRKSVLLANSTIIGSSEYGVVGFRIAKSFQVENCTIDHGPTNNNMGQAIRVFRHAYPLKEGRPHVRIQSNCIRSPSGVYILGCVDSIHVGDNLIVGMERDEPGKRALETRFIRCAKAVVFSNNTVRDFPLPLELGERGNSGAEVRIENGDETVIEVTGNTFINVSSVDAILEIDARKKDVSEVTFEQNTPQEATVDINVSGNTFRGDCLVVRRETNSLRIREPALIAITEWPHRACTIDTTVSCHVRNNLFLDRDDDSAEFYNIITGSKHRKLCSTPLILIGGRQMRL